MRNILAITSAPSGHWVGDGFPVRSLISPQGNPALTSPFLLLDHAGPQSFAPTANPRGVGQHPHRGFETVTIVYDGELEHRDSTGAGGRIGAGDVQWMTAAAGIVHEEFHSRDFTAKGGTLEMVQLWVNLPRKDKSAPPGYQTLTAAGIPQVELADGAGRVRVIAGSFGGRSGPACTFTPIDVWDVRLAGGKQVSFELPEGRTLTVVVLDGTVEINGERIVRASEVALLSRDGGGIAIESAGDAKLLILSGEPIDEPVVAHGPFVMNSVGEIKQAMLDFQSGKFGAIAG
jgi:redox-sensitive bicupin YhaK (pirin superfamily)